MAARPDGHPFRHRVCDAEQFGEKGGKDSAYYSGH